MRYLFLFLIALASFDSYGQVTLSLSQKKSLDSLFSDWESKHKPGGVVAIISENQIIYNKQFGLQDVKRKISFTNETPINLASVAKQFTAMCIALLEEQGEISLDEDIRKFYPKLQYSSPIKIKNLLDHSSGIRELTSIAIFSGKVNIKGELPYKYLNKKHLLEILYKEKDLNFLPGYESSYTNTNYVLLADIVEKVSGMPFESFADSAIFKPLNMHHSYFGDFSSDSEIGGYAYNGKKFRVTNASGGLMGEDNLVSNLNDLLIWDQNFYENILGNNEGELMEKITTSSTLTDGNKANYNYGLNISDYKGYKVISHDGENNLHTSSIVRIPDERVTVICLANSYGYVFPWIKAFQVVDVVLPVTKLEKKEIVPMETVELSQEEIASKAGVFYRITNEGLGQVRKVGSQSGKLSVSPSLDYEGLAFLAKHKSEFVAINGSGHQVNVNFETEESGEMYLIEKYWVYDEDLKFKKITHRPSSLRDYSGTYMDSEHGVFFKIKVKRNCLMLKKGLFRVKLISFEKDLFGEPDGALTLQFTRDATGSVQGLQLDVENIRNFKMQIQR